MKVSGIFFILAGVVFGMFVKNEYALMTTELTPFQWAMLSILLTSSILLIAVGIWLIKKRKP